MFSPHIKTESKKLLLIAIPLTAAYLAELAMFVTSKMVVGQLGYKELAAMGIAADVALEILVVLMGVLSIVGVLCAQAEGANRKKDVGLAVRQGLVISLILGIPATIFVWNMGIVLIWTGQDREVVELAIPYLHSLSGFVLPVLFFAVLRNFVSAVAQPRIVMVIAVVAVLVNYLLTLLLVHGGFGIAALGLRGAGMATNFVSWMMFFWLLWHVYSTSNLRGYGLFADKWKFDPALCREILVLGLPVAGLVFLEAGLFITVTILSGIISTETLAASQIVMAWVGIAFVIGLGIAEGTMVRVAYGVGQNNPAGARLSGLLGLLIGGMVLVLLIVIPVGFAEHIINIFISTEEKGARVVADLAIQFLFIAAIFQVFDGLQAIAARALRGMKDNVKPLWIAGFGYWVLGIGGGLLLVFKFNMGGAGIWWGLAVGLSTTATLLVWRFHRLSTISNGLNV